MTKTPPLKCLTTVTLFLLAFLFMAHPRAFCSQIRDNSRTDQLVEMARKAVESALEQDDQDHLSRVFFNIYQNFSQKLSAMVSGDPQFQSRYKINQLIESQWYRVMSQDILIGSTEDIQNLNFVDKNRFPSAMDIPNLSDQKRRLFLLYGGSIYPVSHWGRMKPLSDHPLEQWFHFLTGATPKDRALTGKILSLLFEDFFNQSPVFSESVLVVSRSRLKTLMTDNHKDVFERLIQNEFFDEAELWLSLCQKYSVPLLKPETEALTEVILPVTCPLLETILSWLKHDHEEMIEKVYDPKTESWIDRDLLKEMIKELLHDDPFSQAQILRSEEIYHSLKNTSKDTKSRFLKNYCKSGKLRNILLQILGQNELKLMIRHHSAKDLFEFFRYINGPTEQMDQIRAYQGYQTLFGTNGPHQENLLNIALQEKRSSFIEYFYFAIKDPTYHFKTEDGDNLVHQVLAGRGSKESYLSKNDESKSLRMMRFFLRSTRFSDQLAEKLLREKNNDGDTPLRFAIKMGLYRCYYAMSGFLIERGAFESEEHRSGPHDDLDLLFLHGLLNRADGSDDPHLISQRSKILTMISEYQYFPPYTAATQETISEFQKLLSKISRDLKSERRTKSYPDEIRYALDWLYKSPIFKAWFKASLKTKMSYLEPVIELLVEDGINSGAFGEYEAARNAISQILGNEKYYMSEKMIEEIKKYINNRWFSGQNEEVYTLAEDQLRSVMNLYQE